VRLPVERIDLTLSQRHVGEVVRRVGVQTLVEELKQRKSRAKVARQNCELDGDAILVFIPKTWKRSDGSKATVAPEGSDAWAPTKARPDETLICALARAHRWNRMLENGRCRSIAEIAEAEKIDCAYVSRLLDLTLLAPDIQEGILEGRQPKIL
jgi:hypothetical protein